MKIKILFRKTWIVRTTVFLAFSVAALSGIAVSKSSLLQEKTQDVQQWTVQTHDGTNFPLIGKHRTVECRECHLNLVFEGTPLSCEACHWERRQDDRYRLRLGAHCADCHTPHSWKNVRANRWNHRTDTGFRLEGLHRTLDCVDCHGDSDLQSASVDCFGCHAEDYSQTREPDHAAAGFPTQCQMCHHNNSRWEDADFLHDFFVLKGQHLSANCSSCHLEGKFSGVSTDCFSCHSTDFSETEDPDHEQLRFPTDCVICHGPNSETWDGAVLNHDSFVLSGQHLLANCLDCHRDGVYAGRSSECVSCHLSDYQNTSEPDHESAGFPTDCTACHRTRAETWEGAVLNHDSFVLGGQHLLADCLDCHGDGVYAGRPAECVSCHLSDYQNTSEPDHESAGFPTDCTACHGTSAETWEGAVLNHDSFVLSGQHLLANCLDCHGDGVYAGRSSECVSCHLSDFQNTTDPDHELLGFPTDCTACHGTSAETWEDASFDHNSIWPLLGAHTTLDCSQCHSSGTELPTDCYGCHADDYESSSNPNHEDVGFPTYCEFCHFPTHITWNQAVFDHDFPIDSGRHGSYDCSDCHLTSNYREFSCTHCHSHNRTRMDKIHRNEEGYSYDSLVCYFCHSDGNF
jgi:hypothetical protein